jgi:hypothetical protein
VQVSLATLQCQMVGYLRRGYPLCRLSNFSHWVAQRESKNPWMTTVSDKKPRNDGLCAVFASTECPPISTESVYFSTESPFSSTFDFLAFSLLLSYFSFKKQREREETT